MRREGRRRIENMGIDFKKISYITGSILSVAVIAFVITFFVYGNRLKNNTELAKMNTSVMDSYMQNVEETSLDFGKTINAVEETMVNDMANNIVVNNIEQPDTEEMTNTTKYAVNTSHIEETMQTSTQKVTEAKENTTNTNTASEKKDESVKDPEFIMPVKGEIVKEFAKDKLVYSNTLGEWIIHNGIDIEADKTTVVKASAEGTVKSIKNDPRYGLTVVIEHTNGFMSTYSNLLTAEFVVVGEKVKQGQTIGTVGNTATFEIADEAHLHFEMTKEGEYLDPELYIKNIDEN